MATFTIGDYKYTTLGSDNRVSAAAADKTKTSYANMSNTVTYGGVTYTVTQIDNCFRNCTSLVNPPTLPTTATYMASTFYKCTALQTAPLIPSGVTNMDYCFYGCTALKSAPYEIPGSVTSLKYCFSDCRLMESVPQLSSGPIYMNYCFSNCMSITTAPSIPASVTDMNHCFHSCRALTAAPSLPQNVVDIGYCFYDCSSMTTPPPALPASVTNTECCLGACTNLTGNITVKCGPTVDSGSNWWKVFSGSGLAGGQIYLIPSNLSIANIRNWRNVVSLDGNEHVHFYGDDAVLRMISMRVSRVLDVYDTTYDEEGEYAYIYAKYEVGGYIPSGYTQTVTKALAKDGTAVTPTWSESVDGNIITVEAWSGQEPNKQAEWRITASDNFEHTAFLESVLPAIAALMDFHEGGDGVAIGTVSTGPGLQVAMNATFEGNTTFENDVNFLDAVKFNNELCYPTFIRTGWSESSDESTLPVTPCFVLNPTNSAYYYCDGQ